MTLYEFQEGILWINCKYSKRFAGYTAKAK